ncbi:WbqC family protein [uncultured Croceitalea sp.]|uniref:WbqC family protein n=1 Tax=uncultured Croceitalea sp. TaxID=1798908 RepID=UPI00330588C9
MNTLLHPTYFPNVATLVTLVNQEVIWEVHDNYQKQTYRNRCHICTDQGKHVLTVPIKHAGGATGRQKYRDVRIDNSYSWQQQHWRTLQTAYRTSAFFEFYEDDLAPIFHKKQDFLLDFNFETIYFLLSNMSLSIPKDKTSSYLTNLEGGNDFRVLATAKKQPIFENTPYFQVFDDRNGFIKNTCGLDLLFNEGTNALTYLQNQKPPLLNG